MRNLRTQLFAALVSTMALSACDTRPTATHTLDIADRVLTLDAPITPGPNTATFEVPFADIEQFAAANSLQANAIKKVKLISATLQASDSSNFDLFESILLQVTTPKVKMKEMALASPIAKGSNSVNAAVAQESDLTPCFAGEPITVVVDANAANEDTLARTLKVSLKFEITAVVKQ